MSVTLKPAAGSLAPSEPHELFALPAFDSELSPYEAGSDGRRFPALENAKHAEPLTVITNWPALLKKTAPAP